MCIYLAEFFLEWEMFQTKVVGESYGILSFMKTRSVAAELFHAEGQRDMTELRLAFNNFANAPENVCLRDRRAWSIVSRLVTYLKFI
jgi:hypothetical protein